MEITTAVTSNRVWATVKNGQIALAFPVTFPNGTPVLLTWKEAMTTEDDLKLLVQQASEPLLMEIWDNEGDEIYAELLIREFGIRRPPVDHRMNSVICPVDHRLKPVSGRRNPPSRVESGRPSLSSADEGRLCNSDTEFIRW